MSDEKADYRRTVWSSVQRGYGTVDEAGLWHPTWGPWHLMPVPHGTLIPSVVALCGADLYRRDRRATRYDYDDAAPAGQVCRKCRRAASEIPSSPGEAS